MCGIIGFLDKHGDQERPLGRTILAMLQALSCRGPDSAGAALDRIAHLDKCHHDERKSPGGHEDKQLPQKTVVIH